MLMNAFRVVAVLLVLATAFILSLFLHLSYIIRFKYFSRSQFNFLAGIIPTLQSETVKTVQFSYQNEIFVTNHIHRHKNQIGRNETIRLAKPLFYTPPTSQTENETNFNYKKFVNNTSVINRIYNMTQDREKLILIYTTSYGNRWLPENWSPDGNLFFLDSPDFTCPKKCVFTDNKNFSSMADAVLFGVLDTIYHSKRAVQKYPEPSERKRGQIWIASTSEPALYHDGKNLQYLNYLFNWTATYRLDSEIYWPYGFFYKLNQSKPLEETNIPNATILKSKKLAASLISNCNALSGRDYVLNSLKKYMEIDSYGKCGDKTCPDDTKCREYLGNHYKFFLAFENSLCEDYVTEKFFASFPVGMVPVTYGLGNYDEIAPPHSFINALDFPNTKALAEYLLHLDKNDEEYLAYFDWRRNYAMGYNGGDIQFCTLCMKVWEPIRPKQLSDGFDAWWISKKNSTTDVNNGTLSKQILQKAKKGCVLFNKILRNNFVLT